MAHYYLKNIEKLSIETIESINNLLKLWYGKKILLNCDVYDEKRTNPQNNYLHKLIRIFAKGLTDQGKRMSLDDLKYELKQSGVFGYSEYEIKGELKRRPKDTHELNIAEISESIEIIKEIASKYEIYLPDADEV